MKRKILFVTFLVLFVKNSKAQLIDSGVELEFKHGMDSMLSGAIGDFKSIAQTIIAVALVVSLIPVIRRVQSGDGTGQKAVTQWVVGLAVYLVFINIF